MIMRKYTIIFFLLFNITLGKAQDFLIVYSKADSLTKIGLFNDAKIEYLKDIRLYDNIITDEAMVKYSVAIYNLCCLYSRLNEKDSAFYLLDKMLSKKTNIHVFEDPDFYNLINDIRWKTLFIRFSKTYFLNTPSLDKFLCFELFSCFLRDQSFYNDIKLNEQKGLPVDYLWRKKDSLNFENLKIIDAINTPEWALNKANVGEDGLNAVFMIIQHADLNYQEKYLSTFEKLCLSGEFKYNEYALLYDRINVRKGLKQKYGTQIGKNDDGSYFLYPLEDRKNINVIRSRVGLMSIEDYVKEYNIKM